MKIEVEVDTLEQLREVLAEGADVVLLDNMSLGDLREAVAMIGGRMIIEASGGVTLESIAGIAETGVDLISVGALTSFGAGVGFGVGCGGGGLGVNAERLEASALRQLLTWRTASCGLRRSRRSNATTNNAAKFETPDPTIRR